MELVRGVLEIGEELGLLNVIPGEIEAIERKGIEGLRCVNLSPRVDIVPPRAAYPIGLLIDREPLDAGHPEARAHTDAARTAAYDGDRQSIQSTDARNTHLALPFRCDSNRREARLSVLLAVGLERRTPDEVRSGGMRVQSTRPLVARSIRLPPFMARIL